MPQIHITDLPPVPALGADLTARQMQRIRGGTGQPIPVEPDGGIGSAPGLPFPALPQLPGFAQLPVFFGMPVPGTRERIPGPAESPIIV
jgi:hypothetical protein